MRVVQAHGDGDAEATLMANNFGPTGPVATMPPRGMIANRAHRTRPIPTVEDHAVERFCLDFAWKDSRVAAALGLQLVWRMLPGPRFVSATSGEATAWDRAFHAETPHNPYEVPLSPLERVSVETPTTNEARILMKEAAWLIQQYISHIAADMIALPRAAPFTDPNALGQIKLYWYAEHHSSLLRNAAVAVDQERSKFAHAGQHTTDRADYDRRFVGALIGMAELMEFLRAHATNNPSIGIADGAACNILRRIQLHLKGAVGISNAEMLEDMFTHRVQDALAGRALAPGVDEAMLHDAFRAAWLAGEYTVAYGLADVEGLTDA